MKGEESVTLVALSPGGFNEYGDPVTSTSTSTTITGCQVAPVLSTEPTARGREGVVIGYDIYAPAGTVASHVNQVVVRGDTLAIVGAPSDWGKGVVIHATRGEG